jgi:hypothetical protein
MRVRVRFRFNTETGEVEVFRIDDLAEGAPQFDHDARHEAAARDVARVVDPHARIVEESGFVVQPEPPNREQIRDTPNNESPSREVHRA